MKDRIFFFYAQTEENEGDSSVSAGREISLFCILCVNVFQCLGKQIWKTLPGHFEADALLPVRSVPV